MNKIVRILSQEITIVTLLGVISVITAWAGVQSSLHSGQSNTSMTFYMERLNSSNNLYLTSELKYRTDLVVWVEKQSILNQGGDINDGYSAGSPELIELGMPCLLENPESQLAECKSYIDALYVPHGELYDEAVQFLEDYEVANEYSDRLQMLTALLAVALFMLGITSVIRKDKLQFAIVLGAIAIAGFSISVLLSVPVVSVSF